MLIGYARVSTSHQETTLQLDALAHAGVQTVYQEKTSSVGKRPQLQALLSVLKAGQVLVVYRMDRLARSLKDLLLILERLEAVGAGFRSLTEPIDTVTPAGRLMMQLLGSVAEFERSLIRERSIAGQVAALKRGTKFGRPKSLSPAQEKAVLRMRAEGRSHRYIAENFGVSQMVTRRVVNEHSGVLPERSPLPVLGRYFDPSDIEAEQHEGPRLRGDRQRRPTGS